MVSENGHKVKIMLHSMDLLVSLFSKVELEFLPRTYVSAQIRSYRQTGRHSGSTSEFKDKIAKLECSQLHSGVNLFYP